MKYLKIENTTNLVWEISGSSFGTGSNFYEVTTSQFYSDMTSVGQLQLSASIVISTTGSPIVSSVNDLDFLEELYNENVIDYKKYRNRLKIYAYLNNFDSLSLDDKNRCAEAFAVAKVDRDKVLSDIEQVKMGREFHYNSVQSRKDRIDASISLLYNSLEIADGKQVAADLVHGVSGSIDNLTWQYETFGIEGTLEGDGNGVFDYILARTGSVFSGSGLNNRNYNVITSKSLSAVCNELIEILRDGHYILDNS